MRRFGLISLLMGLLLAAPLLHAADPYEVRIETAVDVPQGQHHLVDVYIENIGANLDPIGGFQFLLQYDASALSLAGVNAGDMMINCGWELFAHLYGPDAFCGGSPCPSGVVSVNGVAGLLQGSPPTCFLDTTGHLFTMDFLVSDDRTLEGQKIVINFIWYRCVDNSFSNVGGDTVITSNIVRSALDSSVISNPNLGSYPTYAGSQDFDCFDGIGSEPKRQINFNDGFIGIALQDSIDVMIGDIDLNGTPYEIADRDMFRSRLGLGPTIFSFYPQTQTAATDINLNGTPLELADFIYLVRIVNGQASPNPDSVTVWPNPVIFTDDATVHRVEVRTDVPLGAVLLTFAGQISLVTTPQSSAVITSFDGSQTTIFLYTFDSAYVDSGTVIEYAPAGAVDLISAKAATWDASLVSASLDQPTGVLTDASSTPIEFALRQNYPNPFNPVTTIAFDLPKAADYKLTIYNLLGQELKSFTGKASPGTHLVRWDASAYSSGVYLYKLTAEEFRQTQKMLLLK